MHTLEIDGKTMKVSFKTMKDIIPWVDISLAHGAKVVKVWYNQSTSIRGFQYNKSTLAKEFAI